MKSSYFGISIALALLAACTQPTDPVQVSPQQAASTSDVTAIFEKNFSQSCIKEMTTGEDSVDFPIATAICNCAVATLISTYSSPDLMAIDADAEIAKTIVTPIVEKCTSTEIEKYIAEHPGYLKEYISKHPEEAGQNLSDIQAPIEHPADIVWDTCAEGFQAVGNACFKKCPAGYHAASAGVDQCIENIKTIVDRGYFGGCPTGYVDHPTNPEKCALPAIAERYYRNHSR